MGRDCQKRTDARDPITPALSRERAREMRPGVSGRIGYRMPEGGADNPEVYIFAWLHYLVAGLAIDL